MKTSFIFNITLRTRGLIPYFLMSAVLPAEAEADYVVIGSTDRTQYLAGEIIPDSTRVQLVEGEEVRLLHRSGFVVHLKGPFSGVVENDGLNDQNPIDIDLVKGLFREKLTIELGGIRNRESEDHAVPYWDIDLRPRSPICIGEAVKPLIWRRVANIDTVLKITQGEMRERIDWPAGESSTRWPRALILENESSYTFELEPIGLIRHVIIKTSKHDIYSYSYLSWLIRSGCEVQARRFLEKVEPDIERTGE